MNLASTVDLRIEHPSMPSRTRAKLCRRCRHAKAPGQLTCGTTGSAAAPRGAYRLGPLGTTWRGARDGLAAQPRPRGRRRA